MFARHPSLYRLLGSCGVLVGMCGHAHAQSVQQPDPTTGVQLRYDAPEGCGSRELVLQEVRRASGRSLGADVDLEVNAQVRPAEAGFKVRYDARRRGAASKRELLVTDCPAAVEAVALLILLTLEPPSGGAQGESLADAVAGEQAKSDDDDEQSVRVSRRDDARLDVPASNATQSNSSSSSSSQSSQSGTSQSNGAPEAKPPTKEPQATRQTAEPSERASDVEEAQERASSPHVSSTSLALASLRVALNYELATALAPAIANGVRLGFGTAWGGIRGELSGAALWVPNRLGVGDVGYRLASRLYRARAQLGYPIDVGGVWLGPTAGVGIEHLWARVDGISDPASNATTWWTAAVGFDVELRLSRALALRAGGAAFLVTQRPKFTVVNLGVAHQPEPWGVEGAVGVVWTWPTRSGTP